ncbi:hypothetical protein D3C80_1363300 [compost metagenome]
MLDERAIDFQDVDRDGFNEREAGVAGTEVIERNKVPVRPKLVQLDCCGFLVQQRSFGDFKDDGGRRHVVRRHDAGHELRKGWVENVLDGKIDGDVEILARPKVGAVVLGDLAYDRASQLADQLGTLCRSDEHICRNGDAVGVPARKRFGTDQIAGP